MQIQFGELIPPSRSESLACHLQHKNVKDDIYETIILSVVPWSLVIGTEDERV
jgi:hypothetical protein